MQGLPGLVAAQAAYSVQHLASMQTSHLSVEVAVQLPGVPAGPPSDGSHSQVLEILEGSAGRALAQDAA
ncbi:MAG: hypothetical protein DYH12_14415, partial [Sorangiineae bacterium PRO1]|nr:hypothetical protein [Sorangiineae bacterium PRO1]